MARRLRSCNAGSEETSERGPFPLTCAWARKIRIPPQLTGRVKSITRLMSHGKIWILMRLCGHLDRVPQPQFANFFHNKSVVTRVTPAIVQLPECCDRISKGSLTDLLPCNRGM